MPRVVLGIEYAGTNYYGWQHQPHSELPTVQKSVDIAISQVANQSIITVCAGRTDAKVHAINQVVHFDTNATRKMDSWVMGINRFLPPDIKILWATEIGSEFSARRTAIYRTYYYFIYNGQVKPGLFNNYVVWHYKKLNISIMQQAANYWLGEHDFTSFRGRDCQSKTAYRTIYNIIISKQQDLIKIEVTANAFLQHMIRNMVGVLTKVGQGDCEPKWAKRVLLAKDRKAASITALPEGLYLAEVGYPEQFKLPKIVRGFSII